MTTKSTTILIPARDEADVLGSTLQRLLEDGLQPEQIEVVADHCQDGTAQIAASLGVTVRERIDGGAVGKGPAISWWLRQSGPTTDLDAIVIILDADSGFEPGLVDEIGRFFQSGVQVAQTLIEPRPSNESHIALLASFSEKVEQHVFDALRSRLGWPVRLRGTGMAFRRAALETIGADLHTSVEDIELTILALRAGYRIAWIDSSWIYDPKPVNAHSATRQRARWLKGQFEVLRRYWREIISLSLRSMGQWSLMGSMFLKPRTLVLPLKLILASLLTWFAPRAGAGLACLMVPAMLLWLNLGLEVLAILLGLRTLDDPWPTLLALLLSPVYGLMWLRSVVLAVFSKEAWLRGRS